MFNTTRQFIATTALIASMTLPMTAAAEGQIQDSALTQPAAPTYSWERSEDSLETAERAIRQAVDEQLTARGFVEVDGDPELVASLETQTWDEVRVHSHPPMTVRPRVSRWAFFHGVEVVDVREVHLGRFDVALTDAETGEVVWQDGKEGMPRTKMEKNVAKIDKATAKMFKTFELDGAGD